MSGAPMSDIVDYWQERAEDAEQRCEIFVRLVAALEAERDRYKTEYEVAYDSATARAKLVESAEHFLDRVLRERDGWKTRAEQAEAEVERLRRAR